MYTESNDATTSNNLRDKKKFHTFALAMLTEKNIQPFKETTLIQVVVAASENTGGGG